MKFLKSCLVLMVSGALVGCMAEPPRGATEPRGAARTVGSPAEAMRVLSSGGIRAGAEVTSADSNVVTRQTNLWAMTGVSAKANLRHTLTVELADGPAADYVRAQGMRVYAFLRPQMVQHRRSNVSGTIRSLTSPFYITQSQYNCRGYAVVLSPQNNYRVTQTGIVEREIRSQNKLDLGWLSGGEDWTLARIDAFPNVERVSDRAFPLPRYAQARSPFETPCYMDGMREQWR